jgi:hypothetical protein
MMDEKETMPDRVDPREGELVDEEIPPAPADRQVRIQALVDRFSHDASAFDRGFDQLAAGFDTVASAIAAASTGAMPLSRLAGALERGRQEIDSARSMLVLGPDEDGIETYIEIERSLIDQITAQLRDRHTEPAAIQRIDDEVAETRPVGRVALTAGLHGVRLAHQLVEALRRGESDEAVDALAKDARAALVIAKHHLDTSGPPCGARYATYLGRHAQLVDQIMAP